MKISLIIIGFVFLYIIAFKLTMIVLDDKIFPPASKLAVDDGYINHPIYGRYPVEYDEKECPEGFRPFQKPGVCINLNAEIEWCDPFDLNCRTKITLNQSEPMNKY